MIQSFNSSEIFNEVYNSNQTQQLSVVDSEDLSIKSLFDEPVQIVGLNRFNFNFQIKSHFWFKDEYHWSVQHIYWV